MIRNIVLGVVAASVLAVPVSAQEVPTRIGVLTCITSVTMGWTVGSRQKLRCQFQSDKGVSRNYIATVSFVGRNSGIPAGGVLAWEVLTSNTNTNTNANAPAPGIAGKFLGKSRDITLTSGSGANALVGGPRNVLSLRPVSANGPLGENLALGVARITLTPTAKRASHSHGIVAGVRACSTRHSVHC